VTHENFLFLIRFLLLLFGKDSYMISHKGEGMLVYHLKSLKLFQWTVLSQIFRSQKLLERLFVFSTMTFEI